jgi:hypothetical protein
VRKLRDSLLLVVVAFTLAAVCPADQEDEDNYFTGSVVETAPDHLKVSRALQGKTEARVFLMTAKTKIEQGRIRVRDRVTVRYVTGDEGDTAILVIVRPTSTQQKGK